MLFIQTLEAINSISAPQEVKSILCKLLIDFQSGYIKHIQPGRLFINAYKDFDYTFPTRIKSSQNTPTCNLASLLYQLQVIFNLEYNQQRTPNKGLTGLGNIDPNPVGSSAERLELLKTRPRLPL